MIRTDGTQTIAHPPGGFAPAVEQELPELDGPEPQVLMERNYGGLQVELAWHPSLGVTLFVKEGDAPGMVCTVEPEHAHDAFHHPYLYLQAAGLA